MISKHVLALVSLSAIGTGAAAQSNVTLFGVVDLTLAYGKGHGPISTSKTQLTHSGYQSPRIGFCGVEDLGDGNCASLWREGAIAPDVGDAGGATFPTNRGAAVDSNGLNFNRRSFVSLGGKWGEVRLGREYVPTFWSRNLFDPFLINGSTAALTTLGAVGLGTSVTPLPAGQSVRGVVARAANSITYVMPSGPTGLYGQVAYWSGENTRGQGRSPSDGNGAGARMGYKSGGFDVAIAYDRTSYAKTATTGVFRTGNVGGSYDFGPVKAFALYVYDHKESTVAVTGRGWLLGGSVPVGVGDVRFSYSQYEIKSGSFNPKTGLIALGYAHFLSKRTTLYANVARASNRDGAAYALNGSSVSAAPYRTSSVGYDFGVRHTF